MSPQWPNRSVQEEALRLYLRRVLPTRESVEAERMLDVLLSSIEAGVNDGQVSHAIGGVVSKGHHYCQDTGDEYGRYCHCGDERPYPDAPGPMVSPCQDHRPQEGDLMNCQHYKTRAIYEQRPPSEGRKLARVGSRCEGCGKLLASKKSGAP